MRAPYSVHKRQYRHYYRHRDATLRAYALARIAGGSALRISTLQRYTITPEDIRTQLIAARERGLLGGDSTRRYTAVCEALYPGHQVSLDDI